MGGGEMITYKKRVGFDLVQLAIDENIAKNPELVELLEQIKMHYNKSSPYDGGENRNGVIHGYMHPRFWDKDSFESLINEIASLQNIPAFDNRFYSKGSGGSYDRRSNRYLVSGGSLLQGQRMVTRVAGISLM
jgi:hypothetical protein